MMKQDILDPVRSKLMQEHDTPLDVVPAEALGPVKKTGSRLAVPGLVLGLILGLIVGLSPIAHAVGVYLHLQPQYADMASLLGFIVVWGLVGFIAGRLASSS